jgi:signal transduction histidine kinase/ligand-binding sensor domain-containing protein
MQKLFSVIAFCLLLLFGNGLHAQDLRFNQVLRNFKGQVSDMSQDQHGFLWISTYDQGLKRFDGINLKTYTSDQRNPNSLASNLIICMIIDTTNIIWMGTIGAGLEKFDPVNNSFTHFRHDPNDASSLSNDTISSIVEDHLGNLWVGTFGGLDMLDRKTGKFIHYKNDPNDPASLSADEVFKIFEDKNGGLWIGCWEFLNEKSPGKGGLNRFDRKTGKFIRYLHDPQNSRSIGDNRITNLYEDNKGNFWTLTFNAGLYILDRNSGGFTRYYPDPVNTGPLGREPVSEKIFPFASFIAEDVTGALWIGIGTSGMNRYDPVSKKATHFGPVYDGEKLLSAKDTATGMTSGQISKAFNSKDGLFWVGAVDGGLFTLNYNKTTVPFYKIVQREANAFYCEDNGNILWIGTANGLLRRDLKTQKEKLWIHDPKDNNSLAHNRISTMKADEKGNLWLGTRGGGLDKCDPLTGKFTHYKQDPKNPASVASNSFNYLFIDHEKNLWAASDTTISRMDKNTGLFTNFKKNRLDTTGFFCNYILCIEEDRDNFMWFATDKGAVRLDVKTGKFRKYISNNFIKSICIDAKGIIWAGGDLALFYYDKAKDQFVFFADEHSPVGISSVINILNDNKNNLWVSTATYIVKISEDRTKMRKYTDANGVRYSNFLYNDNFKAKDGRLFLGEPEGYYAFYPDQLSDTSIAPQFVISGFKIGDREIKSEPGGILTTPVWQTGEIKLSHDQNVFSFDFFAVDFISPGDEKYLFMLENYDNTWHDIGSDHRAFFFNVPPGKYNFRVKAVGGDGGTTEKSIRIIISPPWWKTWWAYSLYGIFLIIAGYLIYRYQKYYIVKRERERTQQKELAQAKEIEKAYNELKTTQAQLIQSEKMASLGELTAGIAHEIQNPLNFVNNFSEVNSELIGEMKEELSKGNIEVAKKVADDIDDNEKKIIFHGKRADAIVKGMLQHSRNSSGQKELTDINMLADEYLRLAYHGLRAKDKSFNAKFETSFDSSIDKLNIIPQDFGRVILNLINNAFYAVSEKQKQKEKENGKEGVFEPTVTVSTKKLNARPDDPVGRSRVEIKVKDNGNGIPQKVLDKIFQPFFTTKPTGEGTGLGLSMSYDIVTKGHGGELKVETKEGEGSEFIIQLSNIS